MHLDGGLLQVPATVAAYWKYEPEMRGEELWALVAGEMSGVVAPASFSVLCCEFPTCALSRNPHRSQTRLKPFVARP